MTVATSATAPAPRPLREGPRLSRPYWDNAHLARCRCAGGVTVFLVGRKVGGGHATCDMRRALTTSRLSTCVRRPSHVARRMSKTTISSPRLWPARLWKRLAEHCAIALPWGRAPTARECFAQVQAHPKTFRPSKRPCKRPSLPAQTFFNFFPAPPCALSSLLLHLQPSAVGRAFRRGAGNPHSPSD